MGVEKAYEENEKLKRQVYIKTAGKGSCVRKLLQNIFIYKRYFWKIKQKYC